MATKVLILSALLLAPAPFPKPKKTPPFAMAGIWNVKWSGSDVRLDLNADRSARFQYTSGGGTYVGHWKFDDRERVLYLTLQVLGTPRLYVLNLKVDKDSAAGKVSQGGNWSAEVSLIRAKKG